MKQSIYLSALIFFTTVLTIPIKADEPKLDFILRGMDDTRLSLNSGICYVTRMTQNGSDIVTNDKCFVVFDYNKNFYRFDVEGHKGSAKTLRTSDYYYSTIKLDKEYEAVFRSSVNDLNPIGFTCLFDIRSTGLFTPSGPYWIFNYQKISEDIFKRRVDLIEINENDGIIKFVLQAKSKENQSSPAPAKSTFFVDMKRSYTLVKFEDFLLSRITNSHETSWKQINNQWVPVSFVFTSNQGLSAEWTFDWQSVNEPIPKDYFDPNSLSEKTKDLFSLELDNKPIRIGIIGKDVVSTADQPKIKYPYFRYILITTGLILIVIALIKMGYDRWKKKH
jgi:hypothetical protein